MAKKKGQEPQTALTPEEAHAAIISNADALLAMAQGAPEPEEVFQVWDATSPGYLTEQGLGIPRCKCPPESGFFPSDARGAPDLNYIRTVSVPKYPDDPLAIDIECYGKQEAGDTYKYTSTEIGYLVSVVKEFHKARPAQRVGVYMTPPERYGGCSPAGYQPGHPEYDKRWADWTKRNQVMIPLAQEADILFPSLYGLYSEMDQWERFARQNVEQTRMISGDKPILGFLWPTWHNNAEASGPIGYEDWTRMLEVCKSTCDGICIWDFSSERFDASEPWWKATVAFMTKHHLNGY